MSSPYTDSAEGGGAVGSPYTDSAEGGALHIDSAEGGGAVGSPYTDSAEGGGGRSALHIQTALRVGGGRLSIYRQR